MSALCALSDMTPGSSCGGWNVLVEGFTLQSNSAIHYDAAFVYILYNQESRNKFSAHPDEHLSAAVPSVSAAGYTWDPQRTGRRVSRGGGLHWKT